MERCAAATAAHTKGQEPMGDVLNSMQHNAMMRRGNGSPHDGTGADG
jgi:hypothetical protein